VTQRIYAPTTLPGLAAWADAGEAPATADRFVAPDDSEEGEYAALVAAGAAAAELLDASGRRVVVVAEVADPDAAVPLSQWVAVHADTAEGADPDDDLAWFATQEIPHLLDGSAF
jgi:hypothetical protein